MKKKKKKKTSQQLHRNLILNVLNNIKLGYIEKCFNELLKWI